MANKATRAASAITRNMTPAARRLAEETRRRVRAGASPEKALNEAVRATGFKETLSEELVAGINKIVDEDVFKREVWLDTKWPGDDLTLSGKINDLSRFADTKEAIRQTMREGKAWKDAADRLAGQDLTKGDLAGHITELSTQARRVMAGDTEALREYQAALRRSMRQVERLGQAGAPNQRLRVAYQEVIKISQDAEAEALDEAIGRLVQEKAQYNAERIARTEMANAYGQQTYAQALGNDNVIGVGYDLSDRHPAPDICDFHTSVDLFGLGKGAYPMDRLPRYPFHPNCLCTMYLVYEGEIGKMDPKAAAGYLAGLPKDTRQALLGEQGVKDFARQPGTWKENLKGYGGLHDINDLAL